MIITGMAEYESVCKNALVEWYNSHNETKIALENVFVVWACKTLQNYKALLSTTVSGDGIYAEYTSKLERGNANPSLRTLQRLAAGMGMKVKIEFVPASAK